MYCKVRMKRLVDFIARLRAKESISIFSGPLGRWNIDYCKKKMGRKIDLANEDHCGTCGDLHSISQRQKDKVLQ
jgi:hypothetical protein